MVKMDSTEQMNAFVWEECASRDQEERIHIKENGVSVGLEYVKQIATTLQPTIKNAVDTTDDLGNSVLYTNQLSNLTRDINTCDQKNKNFTCQLGLLGNTGAGKTSFLNAIIGWQESLPSNSVQAGTASVCKISYNSNDHPKWRFRAEIRLQNSVSMKNELNRYFNIIQEIKDAEEEDDNGDSFEHIEDLKAQTQSMASKIHMIWGLEQNEVESMCTNQLLNDFPKVRKLLGKKIPIHHAECHPFFGKIRPYLDSTKADHCSDGREFCIWPLVEVVEIYIKDPLLKHGITLVDLPGYGDTNESRVDVTRKYFDKLDLVAVLTPSVRAAHDKKSLDLLSGPQERPMQMDGKYKGNTFAIVIGKVDDMTCESFLKSSAKEDPECNKLVEKLDETQKQIPELLEARGDRERELKTKKRGLKTAKAEQKKLKGATYINDSKDNKNSPANRTLKKAAKEHRAAEQSLERTKNRLESSKEALKLCKSHLMFYCVRERSKIHEKELKSYFRRTQAELARKAKRTDYDGEIGVFPTSSTAYWKLENGETVPGFPNVNYTGIPAFKAWVDTASIPMREEHTDHSLNQLKGILEMARAYSRGETDKLGGDYDRAKLRTEFQSSTDVKLREDLETVFASLLDEARMIKKLQSDPEAQKEFQDVCRMTVHRWGFKYPREQANNTTINWKTYQACLRRKGEAFDSRSKDGRMRYAWIEDLTAIFEDYIKEEWNENLNEQLPYLHRRPETAREWDELWDSFFERVTTAVETIAPCSVRIIESKKKALSNIKQQVDDRLSAALKSASKEARSARNAIQETITEKIESTLDEALGITGGGSFLQRREMLKNFARNGLGKVFREVRSSISRQLTKKIHILQKELNNIVNEAVTKSNDILVPMTSSNQFVTMDDTEMKSAILERERLQEQIKPIVTEWIHRWQSPDESMSFQKKKDPFRIPDQFIVDNDEEEDEEMDDVSDTTVEEILNLISEEDEGSGEESDIKDEEMSDV